MKSPRSLELPNVEPLTWRGDLAARMIAGIDRYLQRATEARAATREERYWRRDTHSWERYRRSVQPNRKRLARLLGVVDPRVPVEMEYIARGDRPAAFRGLDAPLSADKESNASPHYAIYPVRWSVLPGLSAEGLLLEPSGPVAANIIALGDADWTPEEVATGFGGQLAASGCRVLIPTLINRACDYSSVAGQLTNLPHREFIYRAAYELGRHIIGAEIQKILAAADWLEKERRPLGVVGYGEGGLLAFYAAALDERLQAALVSGYFSPRESLFAEPIYRNVWRLLEEFGDAEIASLIAPRALVVEHCPFPAVSGPPPAPPGRSGAAPGAITTPSLAAVRKELRRARRLLGNLSAPFTLVVAESPGSPAALEALARALGLPATPRERREASPPPAIWPLGRPDPEARHKRQFDELVEWTQALMREAEYIRQQYWAKADASDLAAWRRSTRPYRQRFHEEIIGALPEPDLPLHPRGRRLFTEKAFTGYEIVLDVYPDVFAYGILLVPHDIAPGERRPVVVCQHGLEGRPRDLADPRREDNAYHQFACRLTERGFVTFAPQNPYIGGDAFRLLQRRANPLGLSLFSFIIRQHQRIIEFLRTLPFVDGQRIGFYGLSYGGKTAMRVPAVLEDYCLSICSGDFNEWIWKNCSARAPFSYLRTGEYEMPEFNLGMTFNYAEMSYLICPRPFMVERGHWDGVSVDEWVAYEYAKTKRLYDLLEIGERTEIEYFNGPHEIHGVGTFAFLEKHVGPNRSAPASSVSAAAPRAKKKA